MPRRELDQDEIRVLSALSELADSRKGWKFGGVRGWILGTEVNDRTKSSTANLYLSRLRSAGLVFGERISDPGRPRQPLNLWSITQAGEEAIAKLEDREPRRIKAPKLTSDDARIIFISRAAWECLRALQVRREWVLWVQLADDVQALWGRIPHSDDIKPVLNRGFAAREEREGARGRRMFYRVTQPGMAVTLLDQKTNAEIVQLRVSGPG